MTDERSGSPIVHWFENDVIEPMDDFNNPARSGAVSSRSSSGPSSSFSWPRAGA